ncbi:hypothetical protein EMIT047CA2_80141 [Pseudomonas soli]
MRQITTAASDKPGSFTSRTLYLYKNDGFETALALYAYKTGVICDMETTDSDMAIKLPIGCFCPYRQDSPRDIHFRRHNKKEPAL